VRTPEDILPLSEEEREKATRPPPEHSASGRASPTRPRKITATFDEAEPGIQKQKSGGFLWSTTIARGSNICTSLRNKRKLDLVIVVDFIHVHSMSGGHLPPFFPIISQNKMAGCESTCSRKASLVAAGIRRSATLQAIATAQRQAMDDCAGYLLNYSPYLRYDEAWRTACLSLPGSLKALVVIWLRTG
jgi:hypothetical protein